MRSDVAYCDHWLLLNIARSGIQPACNPLPCWLAFAARSAASCAASGRPARQLVASTPLTGRAGPAGSASYCHLATASQPCLARS